MFCFASIGFVLFILIACSKDDPITLSQSQDININIGGKESFGQNDAIFSISGKSIKELTIKVNYTSKVYIGDSVLNKATAYKNCKWKSSDENVISISPTTEGNEVILTAKSVGDAIISVTDEAGKKTLQLKVCVDSDYTADINYDLDMMADLLHFVTPEVVFTEDGVEKFKYVLSESDFITQDSLEYKDNGVIVKRESPKEWKKTVHYQRWGVKTDMIVRYIPKQNVTMDKDAYDFYRSLSWIDAKSIGPSYLGTFTNINISLVVDISITDSGKKIKEDNDGKILKESVIDYIQQLAAHPDTLTSQIHDDGKIEQLKK